MYKFTGILPIERQGVNDSFHLRLCRNFKTYNVRLLWLFSSDSKQINKYDDVLSCILINILVDNTDLNGDNIKNMSLDDLFSIISFILIQSPTTDLSLHFVKFTRIQQIKRHVLTDLSQRCLFLTTKFVEYSFVFCTFV